MVEHLHARRLLLEPPLKGLLDPAQLGTPIGQKRVFDRFRRAAGELALELTLQTGKRGRFMLLFASWAAAGAIGAVIDEGFCRPAPIGGDDRSTPRSTQERGEARNAIDRLATCTDPVGGARRRANRRRDAGRCPRSLDRFVATHVGVGRRMVRSTDQRRLASCGRRRRCRRSGAAETGSAQLVAVTILSRPMANEAALRATEAYMRSPDAPVGSLFQPPAISTPRRSGPTILGCQAPPRGALDDDLP